MGPGLSALLAQLQGADDAAAEASLAEMEALLRQGHSLRLGLSELQPLQALLGKAEAWEAEAQCLIGPGESEPETGSLNLRLAMPMI